MTEQTPQNLTRSRAEAVTRACVDDFFCLVEKKFKALEAIHDIISPSHIFNCDEAGFSCSQGEKKIVCRRFFRKYRQANVSKFNKYTA